MYPKISNFHLCCDFSSVEMTSAVNFAIFSGGLTDPRSAKLNSYPIQFTILERSMKYHLDELPTVPAKSIYTYFNFPL